MTNEQLKEALTGDWLIDFASDLKKEEKDDCSIATQMESEMGLGFLLHLMAAERPLHQVMHLIIAGCRFGYAYRIREVEMEELRRIAK